MEYAEGIARTIPRKVLAMPDDVSRTELALIGMEAEVRR